MASAIGVLAVEASARNSLAGEVIRPGIAATLGDLMLLLRVFGDSSTMGEVAGHLGALPGASHVSVTAGGSDGDALVMADLSAAVADGALEMVRGLGVSAEDVSLLRLDAIGPGGGEDTTVAVVWADLLGQARVNARTAVRYLVFMAVAGVIAAFGVIDRDQILIVGAMAVAPDLLPVTAACTGVVLRRPRLIRQGLVSLTVGLAVACVFAAAVTGLLSLCGLLPVNFSAEEVGLASQQHVQAETILVALAAGVAGMLAVETRASMGVGVAISVTTIPAAAFLGVAAGVGELSKSLGALSVLAVNIAMMLTGGSLALMAQRRLAPRFEP
jgi:uncharacterized hydrophobic protein (TIGR00271 family)